MNISQIENKIINIVKKILINNQINSDSIIKDICDELDLIEIIMAIEKDFDMYIPDEILSEFNTVKEIIDYVVNIELDNRKQKIERLL